MATKQVNVPEIGTVTLYKRRGNRSLRLSISHDGDIRVSLPYWLPYTAGEQFVRSKQEWIATHLPKKQVLLQNGQSIGKAHHLYFIADNSLAKPKTHVTDTEVRISIPTNVAVSSASAQQAATTAGLRALRKEAEHLLPQRLKILSQQTGLNYTSVSVRQLKSRWGSCDNHKEITLSIFLMQLPWHLIDYVLIHELTHTKVMRHGAPFWEELEYHLPRAKQLRKEMAAYQPILTPGQLVVA
jgi:predicted metal-dependent hydrolase